MPLTAVAPPEPVPIFSGFDYVTVDSVRRRVYAAHTASQTLLVVDADSGKVLGQVRVGPMHGVAVDPATGHVFTGNGTDRSVSEIDPETLKVLRTADVPGEVDAIAFDPGNGRIYADEDNGTHVFVVDAATMKSVGAVDLPGHKPEYLAVDQKTHAVYQNIADLNEIAVIDPATLKVTRTFPTPAVTSNHPLQYDAAYGHILVGGTNGTIAAYDTAGTLVGTVAIQPRVDQCSLDQISHQLACAGSGVLSLVRDMPSSAPIAVASTAVAKGAHTVGYDSKAGNVWIVWAEPAGDFVQAFRPAP
jgi:DNA-binding beta-propeller fold protein YncE